MSDVWQNGPKDQSERFVLLALADYANDDGECWPSIAGICQKTCMTDRGVQKIIRRLEDGGWLSIEVGVGRKNCNVYTIKNPEPRSPRTTFTPNVVAETPNVVPKNPEPRSPEPSLTIKEPSAEQNRFDEFYEAFPKKKDPQKARAAYARAVKKVSPDVLIAAAKRYAQERAGQDPQFTKHPTSWLNAGSWENQQDSRPPSGPPKPGDTRINYKGVKQTYHGAMAGWLND